MKKFLIIPLIPAALFLSLLGVSNIFIKNILAAVPNRNAVLPDSPASAQDSAAKAPENSAQRTYIANRERFRAEGSAFEKTTSQAEITSADGLKLRARYRMQDAETHSWVLSIHGYKDSHRFMLPYGAAFYKKGFHVLMPDNRAHGASEGAYIGMGWLDKEDIALWVRWIVEKDPQAKIILHGVSMGGATVMMTAGMNLEHVAGYIEDCGYTSVWDIFACVMKRDYHLPAFPILHMCRIICRRRIGYDYVEASSLTQLAKCRQPILFIHGEKDDFVPLQMGLQAYESYSGKKELYIAKNAGHANSMDFDPDLYYEKVFGFIDKFF